MDRCVFICNRLCTVGHCFLAHCMSLQINHDTNIDALLMVSTPQDLPTFKLFHNAWPAEATPFMLV